MTDQHTIILRDHIKNIIKKLNGVIMNDENTDNFIENSISEKIKELNISDNKLKIIIGSILVLDESLKNNSEPQNLIDSMNDIIRCQIEFFNLIIPATNKDIEENKNDIINDNN